jgi:hypothetical protein
MNSNMTAAALLILCTSIERRGGHSNRVNRPANPRQRPRDIAIEMEMGLVLSNKTGGWETLPDLEFKSETTIEATIISNPRDTATVLRLENATDDIILPYGAWSPRRSLIGLGISRGVGWLAAPRNSRSSSTNSLRPSKEENEIWGIKEALAHTKDLPPLPK